MLKGINVSAGYRTDIGFNARVGLTAGQATDAPVLWLTPEEDRAAPEYGSSLTETTYVFTAVVKRRDIADIRQCMETTDTTLAGLTERIRYQSAQPAYREDAGELIGCRLTYTIQYRIAKGDPDTVFA